MTYVTIRQHLSKSTSWENVFFEKPVNPLKQKSWCSGTVTRKYETPEDKYLKAINVDEMIKILHDFNERHEDLFTKDRKDLYRHFSIPKKTGGMRPIDAPVPELQYALRELVNILTKEFGLLYHTAAFAYIKKRNIVDCGSRHQDNESMWFLKTDFSGFFPSTTLNFVKKMLGMIFPTSEICKNEEGKKELEKDLSLGFLNGGLPQGTVLSPTLTSIMMIPIDHKLFNELTKRKIVYTRYADDIHISAKEKFPWKDIVKFIRETLKEFDAPFILKDEKTHFGSRKGRNWNLGLMLNKDNNVTFGYRNKKLFKAMMTNFIMDTRNHLLWKTEDVRSIGGKLSYYKMVEPEYFNHLVDHFERKFHVRIPEMFKYYLS